MAAQFGNFFKANGHDASFLDVVTPFERNNSLHDKVSKGEAVGLRSMKTKAFGNRPTTAAVRNAANNFSLPCDTADIQATFASLNNSVLTPIEREKLWDASWMGGMLAVIESSATQPRPYIGFLANPILSGDPHSQGSIQTSFKDTMVGEIANRLSPNSSSKEHGCRVVCVWS